MYRWKNMESRVKTNFQSMTLVVTTGPLDRKCWVVSKATVERRKWLERARTIFWGSSPFYFHLRICLRVHVTQRGEDRSPDTQIRGKWRRWCWILNVVPCRWSGLTAQTFVLHHATWEVLGCWRSFWAEVSGLWAGQADVSWRRQLSLAVSGNTELLQHSTGGDEASHAGQVEESEHARNLKTKGGAFNILTWAHTNPTPQVFKMCNNENKCNSKLLTLVKCW